MTAHDWETWKLSHAFRIGSGTTPTSSDARYYTDSDGTPWVTTAELRENYISSTQQQVTQDALDDFTALRVYRPGSVMMAMYGATIGRLGITEIAATCNQACCVFEASEQFDNRFLFYWLWHRRDNLIAMSVGGGQPNLSQQDLRKERALCPPLETQRRIARFLDEKTARIDGLIEKKRALLDRLAEKRQALITRAVTKGLNPDAPMKPSGIDWLGDIPVHWDVFLVKRRFDVQYGIGGEIDRSIEQGTRLLSLPNITKEGRFWLEEVPFTEAATPDDLLREGDLLFNWRNGSTQHLGKTVRFDLVGEWSHVSFLLRLRAKHQDTYSGFLRYFLNGLRETDFFVYAKAGVNNTFNLFELRNLPVISPPTLSEQREIADYLDELVAALDTASDSIRASILYLDEYRAALITAAVNGQIAELP